MTETKKSYPKTEKKYMTISTDGLYYEGVVHNGKAAKARKTKENGEDRVVLTVDGTQYTSSPKAVNKIGPYYTLTYDDHIHFVTFLSEESSKVGKAALVLARGSKVELRTTSGSIPNPDANRFA